MTSKRFESYPFKVLILSKMYRHGFNYMCGFSPDWKRFVRAPRHPYDVKCSKQEGVKAGRPTPYIGAPSEVN